MIYEVSPIQSEYQGPTVFDVVRGSPYDGASQTLTDRKPLDSVDRVPYLPYKIDFANNTVCLKKGWVIGIDPTLLATPMVIVAPTIGGGDMDGTGAGSAISTGPTHTIYCKVLTNWNDLVTSAEIISASSTPTSVHAQPAVLNIDGSTTSASIDGVYYYPILDFDPASAVLKVRNVYHRGSPIVHRPGRTGMSGHTHFVDCAGNNVAYLDFIQGQFNSVLGEQTVEAGCDGTSSSS